MLGFLLLLVAICSGRKLARIPAVYVEGYISVVEIPPRKIGRRITYYAACFGSASVTFAIRLKSTGRV